jgi:hypothetical protein
VGCGRPHATGQPRSRWSRGPAVTSKVGQFPISQDRTAPAGSAEAPR